MGRWRAKNVAIPAAAVLLLLGATADRMSVRPPADAQPYHQAVREAADRLPMRIGDWVGKEAPQPESAIQLLRPNVIISREYQNMMTGSDRTVTLLVVQCPDARDLLGHFPPICYPNQGWKLVEQRPRVWKVEGSTIDGTEYKFLKPNGGVPRIIRNFMVLPNGTFAPNMDAIDQMSKNVERRFYGAAQVQLIMDESIPERERENIFETLMSGNWSLIEAIRSGAGR